MHVQPTLVPSVSIDLSPRGSTFVRAVIARALPDVAATEYAAGRWGATSHAANLVTKAAVPAGASTGGWAGALAEGRAAAREFVELVRAQTIVGRLANLRRVPPDIPVALVANGSTAYWVGEAKPRPMSAMAFERTRLKPLTVAALIAFSKDLLRFASPEAEAVIRNDLVTAAAELTDISFIDPAAAGVADVVPASITYGAPAIASSGTDADAVRADLLALFSAYQGDLRTAALVLSPKTSIRLSMLQSPLGDVDLTVHGGSLFGIPVVASSSVPDDLIVLLDAAGILLVDEGVEIDTAEHASIEMSDAPTNAAAPAPISSTMVSLFQTGSVALRLTRHVNWQRARAGSVVVLNGIAWGD